MAAININQFNYHSEVLESDKKVLLDFWAPWCGPCRMVVPIVEEIAGERPDIKVGKINVDEEPELARQFGIVSIPTLVVMEKGRITEQARGARSKKAILDMLSTTSGAAKAAPVNILSLTRIGKNRIMWVEIKFTGGKTV